MPKPFSTPMARRFNGHLPVIVDVETGGINPQTDALLEVAIVFIDFDENHQLVPTTTLHEHVEPFEGGGLSPEALKVNQIIPEHPFRFAKPEQEALTVLCEGVWEEVKKQGCQRAYLVGHNSWFDLLFMRQAMRRTKIKDAQNPFHRFTSMDTATMSAVAYGQTVLARAVSAAGIKFDRNEAHSAIYDAQKTAELFCTIINGIKPLKRRR